jgi:glutaredoxin
MKITVYSQPACPKCDLAKSYLTDFREVEFETKDISVDAKAKQEVSDMGFMATPVIVIEGHEPITWDRNKLDEIFEG